MSRLMLTTMSDSSGVGNRVSGCLGVGMPRNIVGRLHYHKPLLDFGRAYCGLPTMDEQTHRPEKAKAEQDHGSEAKLGVWTLGGQGKKANPLTR